MTRKIFSVFCFAVALFVSCGKESGTDEKEGSANLLCMTSEASGVTQTSAILNGTATIKNAKASNANAYFYYSTTQADAKTLKASGQRLSAGTIPNTGGDFSANLGSLSPATTYYYVASVSIDDQEELGGVKSFTTEKKTDSFSVTGAAIDITVNSATLTAYANLPADMTGDVTIGIIYSTSSSPSLQNGKLLTSKDLDGNNMYQLEATDLTPDTKYYFKSFLSRSNLNYYGEVKEFTTAQVLASVSTLDAWDVAETKAMVGGKVEISSKGVLSKSAVIYHGTDGTSADALKTKGKKVTIEAIDEDGSFKAELTSLTASTKYYFIAVVTVEGVEFAGAIKNFTTQDKPTEISVTGESADIGESSAKLYGWCNQEGAEGTSVVFGIEYSATDLTTAATTITASDKDPENKYCCQATGLSSNTLYYYRAFTLFNGVRSYGEVKSFTTLDFSVTVSTSDASDVTEFSATLNGIVSVNSKDELYKSATFIYSRTESNVENLISSGSRVLAAIQEDGSLNSTISNLAYNANYYYVAAVRVHDKEYVYGDVKMLKTKTIHAEVSSSNISESYATLNCIMPSGGNYSDVRVYYSPLSSNVDDILNGASASTWSSGGNEFNISISKLEFNTTYYYLFYVKANNEEYISEVSSFTTSNIDLSITTNEFIYELSGMGLVEGSYTYHANDNHSVQVGFFYGKQNDKDAILQSRSVITLTNNDYYSSFASEGTFTSFFNYLVLNTTYYYLAFMKIDNTFIYGDIKSFKSLDSSVDLGLSVKWGGMNVGASSAVNRGGYYAWGEITTKSNYDNSTYTGPFVSVLPLENDVAHMTLGGTWRMPTKAEYTELIDNCTWSLVKTSSRDNAVYINGAAQGYIVSGKKEGYQKKAIFLPGGGYKVGTSGGNSMCQYWASTNQMSANHYADCLTADDHDIKTATGAPDWGYLIRPVCE